MEMSIEKTLTAIQSATNTSELKEPIECLIKYIHGEMKWSELTDIVKVARNRISDLRNLTDLHDHLDSDQSPGKRIINWFGQLAQQLARYDSEATACDLLIELWNEFGEYQRTRNEKNDSPKPFYRAGIGMYTGQLYLRCGERGGAIWWLLHAHADDLLNGQERGAAHDMLQFVFGVPESVFDYLKSKKDSNSNQPYTLFAEHLVMQLSLNQEFAYLFSYPSSQPEFSIGRAYAKTMLSRIEPNGPNGNLEGKPLEDFVRYLVLLLSGWVPTENVYHNRSGIDSDVVARYIRAPESIAHSHPPAILIECKNTKDAVSVADTGYFLYRMNLTQVDVGILFVRNNVSGGGTDSVDYTNAKHLLDLAFQQSGVAIVVIDLDDLRKIADGKQSLWALIDAGIVKRRFGTPRGPGN